MVVWDLGNVVIPWDRRRALARFVDEDDVERVATEVFDMATNHQLDSGTPLHDVVADVESRHPGQGWVVEAYVEHFHHSLGPVDVATEALIDELLATGVRCVALSNWSGVCWRDIPETYPVLTRLDGVVISGHELVSKPDPEIYRRCESRFGFTARQALFFDDSVVNVAGATDVGWDAEVFTGAHSARTSLVTRGLLRGP